MLGILLRPAAVVGPEVTWIIRYIMAVYAVFVVCIVIAMRATLRAKDPGTRKIAYLVFCDLLALFARRRRGRTPLGCRKPCYPKRPGHTCGSGCRAVCRAKTRS